MLFRTLLNFAAFFCAAAIVNPATNFLNMIVHDQRSAAPDGFTLQRLAESTQAIRLRIGLRQSNMTGLQDTLMDISTPGNARYGKHLTREQVQ